jgi:hypothetical protein
MFNTAVCLTAIHIRLSLFAMKALETILLEHVTKL